LKILCRRQGVSDVLLAISRNAPGAGLPHQPGIRIPLGELISERKMLADEHGK